MEKLESCPVCGGNIKKAINVKDHFLTSEWFSLNKCNNCNLLLTNPRPNINEIGKYYNTSDYISHNRKKTSLISIIYKTARTFTLSNKVKLINKFSNKGALLDYGCGTGDFLNKAATNGWASYGFEPNQNAANQAEEYKNITVYKEKNQLKDLKINTITLWHVLEHVHELNNTLNLFNNIITKNGFLFIAVPNPYSYDASIYGKEWAAYDVPRHLYHFSKNSIENLLEANNFILKEIKPLKLDAFYISLMSEKYKTGKANFIKAFINGFKSNIKAKKSINHSSLIYIAQKK